MWPLLRCKNPSEIESCYGFNSDELLDKLQDDEKLKAQLQSGDASTVPEKL